MIGVESELGNAIKERRDGTPPLRVPVQLPVEFFARSPSFPIYTPSSTALNVSTGGMFIKTSRYVKPGTTVEVEFTLNGAERIRTRARVVWASEGVSGNIASYAQGIGIQFISLPPQALQQIHELSAQYREFP